MTLTRYACWDADSARQILATEALQGHEAQFLATHTPIEDFELEGPLAAMVATRTEQGLLDAVTKKTLRHLFSVVEGEPGSGKSHLIRWLSVKWPVETDEVILIQRAEGSLEGTLRRLKDSLPEEFAPLFQGMGQMQRATEAGRARDFQYVLGNSLKADYFESDPPVHAKWCEDWDAAKILTSHAAIERWSAPLRILTVISGNHGDRNSALAQFTLSDMADLGELQREIKEIGPKALMLLRQLNMEAGKIRAAEKEGLPSEQVAPKVPNSAKLMEALNKRLNHAIQHFLGISAQGLKDLFRNLRRELRKRDRRLVLLLEDITSFQGVDDQLIDVLIAQSETEPDGSLCDLISVVGITPAYFHQHLSTLGNVRGRINIHIRLGSATDGSVFQAVSSLRSEEERRRFAATYLRAVRVGAHNLDAWLDDTGGQGFVPNRCDDCPHREVCHATFGSHRFEETESEVGLYPFTMRSIDRMFSALKDPKGGMTLQTPRGMLQGVLTPSLLKDEAMSDGRFPPPEIEHKWLPEEERLLLSSILQTIVDGRVSDEELRGRVRRTIAWWGRRDSAKTTEGPDGSLSFAGVPRGVFEAFSLPWLGEEEGAEVRPAPVLAPEPERPAPGPAERSHEARETREKLTPELGGQTDTRPPRKPASSQGRNLGTVSETELQRRRTELTTWAGGGRLNEPAYWSLRLFELFKGLPWRHLGIDAFLQHGLMTEALVTLEGGTKPGRAHLVLPREAWVREGLEAHLVLRTRPAPPDEPLDYHRENLARMLRRLSRLIQAHIDGLVPRQADGSAWSPAVTIAQVLLARTWLRGGVDPEAPRAQQWSAVLSSEGIATSAPDRRVDSWRELLDKTQGSHDMLREALRQMVNLPADAWDKGLSIADVAEVAPAVLRMHQTMKIDPFPAPAGLPRQLTELDRATELAGEVGNRLERIPSRERDRLLKAIEAIDEACRNHALPSYLGRVSNVLAQLPGVLPDIPAVPLTEAARAKDQLEKAELVGDRLERLDNFLADVAEERDAIEARRGAALLSWNLSAPARDLALMREGVEVFERSLKRLAEYVETYVQESGGHESASIASVREAGARLQQEAAALRAQFEVTHA